MLGYRFDLGDLVCFRNWSASALTIPDPFEITALLPQRGGVPQYRVRGEGEKYERVVLEDEIELVRDRAAANNNVPAHMRK